MLQMTKFMDKSCILEANSSSSSQETSWTLWSPSAQYQAHKTQNGSYPEPNKSSPHLPIILV
jgi:hypothetical protein